MTTANTPPPAAQAATDDFPVSAWADIHVEAPNILHLPLSSSTGLLRVSIVNDSQATLDIGALGPLSLNYRLFDPEGRRLGVNRVGVQLTGRVPPGTSRCEELEIHIPSQLNEQAASARVGLGRPDGTRASRLHRYEARTVLFDRGKSLSRLQDIMLQGARIWPLGRSNGLRWPSSAMMVSEKHRLLYIPVAKCACTSLKTAMLELAEVEQYQKAIEMGVHLITDRFNTGVQLKDKTMKQAWEILASPDYFKFMVIREPFERLVSAYLEKFVYNRHNQRNLLHTRRVMEQAQGTRDIDLQQGISFDDFISTLVSCEEQQLDPHWRPQYLYRKTVKHHINTYKLESIDKLEGALGEITGQPLQLGHRNRTRKSSELLSGVARLSAAEIEQLGDFNPRSFESSTMRDAVARYYQRDLALYHAAQ